MLKQIFRVLAAALAALPRFVIRVCRDTGKIITEMIPSAPAGGLTTSAGLEADDALMELRQAQEEAQVFEMSLGKTVYAYAAAVVSGSTPPDVSQLPEPWRQWLEELDVPSCRQLFSCTETQIQRHLAPRAPSDRIAGIPPVARRPPWVEDEGEATAEPTWPKPA